MGTGATGVRPVGLIPAPSAQRWAEGGVEIIISAKDGLSDRCVWGLSRVRGWCRKMQRRRRMGCGS